MLKKKQGAKFYIFAENQEKGGLKSKIFPNFRKRGSKFYNVEKKQGAKFYRRFKVGGGGGGGGGRGGYTAEPTY